MDLIAVFSAVVVIAAFAAFIIWARSYTGQHALESRLGASSSLKRRRRAAKKQAAGRKPVARR